MVLDAATEHQAIASARKLIELRGGLSHKYSQEYWRFSTKAELRGPVERDERFLQGIKDAPVKQHGRVCQARREDAMAKKNKKSKKAEKKLIKKVAKKMIKKAKKVAKKKKKKLEAEIEDAEVENTDLENREVSGNELPPSAFST